VPECSVNTGARSKDVQHRGSALQSEEPNSTLAADVARCVAASQVRYHLVSRATPLNRRSVSPPGRIEEDTCQRVGAFWPQSLRSPFPRR